MDDIELEVARQVPRPRVRNLKERHKVLQKQEVPPPTARTRKQNTGVAQKRFAFKRGFLHCSLTFRTKSFSCRPSSDSNDFGLNARLAISSAE